MLTRPQQQNYQPSYPIKPFQFEAPPDTPFLETRGGKVYQKYEFTQEYQQEKEVRDNIKSELREYFYEDMIANPQKVDSIIKQIREKNWESLDEIPSDYIIDIDKCELLLKDGLLKKLQKDTEQKEVKDEVQSLETFLNSKFRSSLENFRIEINYNIVPQIGLYREKIKYKTHLENPFTVQKKPYWYGDDLNYGFNDEDSNSSENWNGNDKDDHNSYQTQLEYLRYSKTEYVLDSEHGFVEKTVSTDHQKSSSNDKKNVTSGNTCDQSTHAKETQGDDDDDINRDRLKKQKLKKSLQSSQIKNSNQANDNNTKQKREEKQTIFIKNSNKSSIKGRELKADESKLNTKRPFSQISQQDRVEIDVSVTKRGDGISLKKMKKADQMEGENSLFPGLDQAKSKACYNLGDEKVNAI